MVAMLVLTVVVRVATMIGVIVMICMAGMVMTVLGVAVVFMLCHLVLDLTALMMSVVSMTMMSMMMTMQMVHGGRREHDKQSRDEHHRSADFADVKCLDTAL